MTTETRRLRNSHGGAGSLAATVVEALPFYVDQSAACFGVVDDCLEQCFDIDNGSPDEVAYTDIGVCWNVGFNGTCDSYARGHVKCGGTYADGSDEECHALCESTTGAWTDDLDLLCEESCPD